nr:retrovirus-related Pol polyprotein from transposon TNT 1-94 [Tanacetum cinerariifolium]
YDWLEDTNEEVDEQELEAHYSYMAKIHDVPTVYSGTDAEPVEQVQNDAGYNVFANVLQHSEQSESNDQNDVESDDERVALSNLIANIKLNVNENIKIQKHLKKANTTLAQELKDCKTILAKTSKSLRESISVRDSCLVALLTKLAGFEKYKALKDRTIDYDKLERKLNEALGQLAQKDTVIREDLFRAPTAHDMEILIQTCLMPLTIKTQSDSLKFVHELKQEMLADLKYVESLEKEINKLKSDKAEFSDMYDVIFQECVSKDVMFSYLQSLSDLDTLAELQCMYLHKENIQFLLRLLCKIVKNRSVSKANVSEGLSKPVTAQTLPQAAKKAIVQLILLIVDSGCTMHMTGNLRLLCNFVEKFIGTVRFGNDQFVPILGYGNLVEGNVTINRVYYVAGLNYNLFSVGQFWDADLEVAFRKSTFFVRDLQGNDLLVGNHGSDLYTISLQESTSLTSLCLMAKATPTQAWLWHRRLSHLNFDYINLLLKKDIVIGLPKLKYVKDQLCLFCKLSKAKRNSFKSKVVPSFKGRLNLLHMEHLCGPMRVASINGKKYILVIVDDYLRYTWTLFLCSKDETPEMLKDFLTMIQRNLQALVITVRTDRGTEDGENLDKMKEKGDQCILAGYSTQSKGYGVYNKRTRMIVESIYIRFNEIKEGSETSVANNTLGLVPQRQKASDYDNPDPVPQRQKASDYDNPDPSTSASSPHTNVHAEENNNDQAEEGEQIQDDEFTNPLCAPAQEEVESSSHNIVNLNVSNFNQQDVSEYRWTKDHPLEL